MHERRSPLRRRPLSPADSARVAAVFEEHRAFIVNVARQHAVNADAVPDIVQSVAMKVCIGLQTFRGDAQVKTWLYRITVNEARRYYREHSRQERIQDAMSAAPMPDLVEEPDDRVLMTQRIEAVARAIKQLRPIYRDALMHGLTGGNGNGSGTHGVERINESTLRTRRHRAQLQTRRILGE